MISGRQRQTTPSVPVLLLLFAVVVVSTLGIVRGARMRDMLDVLARRYLRERARSKT